jgi:alpha-glucosidase
MTNTTFNSREDFDDVRARNQFTLRRAEGASDEQIIADLADVSRDNARTPMQWDTSAQSGFTTGKPWLKVNPNYTSINVAQQLEDPKSIFNFYRRLIQVRKDSQSLLYGVYDLVMAKHEQIYAYTRTLDSQKVLVLTNLTGEVAEGEIEGVVLDGAKTLLSNGEAKNWTGSRVRLAPFEAHVLQLS